MNWQGGGPVLEAMGRGAVAKGIVTALEAFLPATDTHTAMKYNLEIDAKILGKRDRDWDGGWKFCMTSEGVSGQAGGIMPHMTIAKNPKPLEEPTGNSNRSPREEPVAGEEEDEEEDGEDNPWWEMEEDSDDD